MIRIRTFAMAAVAMAFAAGLQAQRPTTPTLTVDPPPPAATEMSFNFRGVPVEDVLDAMSRNLGLVVVRNVTPTGNVDVLSHQPLDAQEAVSMLNTVLHEKGYAGILRGRTLTIVKRDEARTQNVPVRRGGDPEQIPDTSEMVTQIIPLRHASVKEIAEDLQPLIPSWASMTANESSNALLLTDTQSGARRIAEIVAALDESISEISTLRVYALSYADAKQVADTVTKLFEQPSSTGNSRNRTQGGFQGPFGGRGFFRPGGEGGGGNSDAAQGTSAALQAASRVVAVADERTNSLIVSAPENVLPIIESLVDSIDRSTDVLTEVRVFPLQHSSATEMAQVITGIFAAEQASQQSQQRNRQNRRFGGFPFGQQSTQQPEQGSRAEAESTVLAVADTRTNSVVVSAVPGTMEQVANVVRGLDANPAKTKRVYVYPLKNANPEEVSTMLEGMFGGSTGASGNNRNTGTNRNASTRNTNNTNSNRNTRNNSNNSGRN